MSVIIRGQGIATSFSDKTASDVTDGLVCMSMFGGSIGNSTKDRSLNSDATLTQVGDVVVNANDVEFTSTIDYFQTDIPEPDDYTIFAVARLPGNPVETTGRGVIVGNYSGAAVGMAFGYQNANNATVVHGRRMVMLDGQPSGQALFASINAGNPAPFDITQWALYVGSFASSNFRIWLRNETANQEAETIGEGSYLGVSKALTALRIGSHNLTASSQGGPSIQSQFRMYNRVLSATEIAAVVAEMRNWETVVNGRTV